MIMDRGVDRAVVDGLAKLGGKVHLGIVSLRVPFTLRLPKGCQKLRFWVHLFDGMCSMFLVLKH
jgi:hypothetical protein